MKIKLFILSYAYSLLLPGSAFAEDLSAASFFSNHAVVQCGRPLPVWGRATPGESITVGFAGQVRRATTGADGAWSVTLPAFDAGTRGSLRVAGKSTLEFKDVVVGELWFCSGQSNMQWTVEKSLNAEQEISSADFPDIRHFTVPLRTAKQTLTELPDRSAVWQPATPQTTGGFSAVAWFFARHLHQQLKVPVGVINSSWGGTPIHPWMTPESIETWEHYPAMIEGKRQEIDSWPERKKEFDEKIRHWEIEVAAAKAEGREEPKRPWLPGPPDAGQYMPSNLYHAMVHPFTRLPLRGFLWYQGESNAGSGEGGGMRYTELQNRLIGGWRKAWGHDAMPFYFVQLANFTQPADATGINWAYLREGQQGSLVVPNTGMASAIDIGEADDVHPRNKQEVGRRLALLALSQTYQKMNIQAHGPEFLAAKTEAGAIRVSFRHADGGLKTRDGAPPSAFEIAAGDLRFVAASARIDGGSILVNSPEVPEPAHVRHAFSNNPAVNVTNGANLPLLPFRSDVPSNAK